jgi:hypothetical protein
LFHAGVNFGSPSASAPIRNISSQSASLAVASNQSEVEVDNEADNEAEKERAELAQAVKSALAADRAKAPKVKSRAAPSPAIIFLQMTTTGAQAQSRWQGE